MQQPDIVNDVVRTYLNDACNEAIALILSEALYVYNYRNNGRLCNLDIVTDWYENYFEATLSAITNRTTTASVLAPLIAKTYPTTIYNQVEKAILEDRSPAVTIVNKGGNPDLDIEGIPSIKKGDKTVLNKIFEDAIEDVVLANKEELHLDTVLFDDLTKYKDDFGLFGTFLYRNRDLDLNINNLADMPDGTKISNPSILYQQRKGEQKAERSDRKDYNKEVHQNIQDTPTLKDARDRILDVQYVKKYGARPPTEAALIPGTTYIGRYLLNSNSKVTLQDLNYAIDCTKKSYDTYLSLSDGIDRITDNDKRMKALEALRIQAQASKALYTDLFNLFRKVSKNTPNEQFFTNLGAIQNSPNTNNYNNIENTLSAMRRMVGNERSRQHDSSNISKEAKQHNVQITKTAGQITQLTDRLRQLSNMSGMSVDGRDAAAVDKDITVTYKNLATLLSDKVEKRMSRREINDRQQLINYDADTLKKLRYILPEEVASNLRKSLHSSSEEAIRSDDSLKQVFNGINLAKDYTKKAASVLPDTDPNKANYIRSTSNYVFRDSNSLRTYLNNKAQAAAERNPRFANASANEKQNILNRYWVSELDRIKNQTMQNYTRANEANTNNIRSILVNHPVAKKVMEDLYSRGIVRNQHDANRMRRMTRTDILKVRQKIYTRMHQNQALLSKHKNPKSNLVNYDVQLLPNQSKPNARQISSIIRAADRTVDAYINKESVQPQLHIVDEREREYSKSEVRERSLFGTGLQAIGAIINSTPSLVDSLKLIWSSRKDAARLWSNLKNAVRFIGIMLPTKGNIETFFDDKKFGFGQFANKDIFDYCYKMTCGIKKMLTWNRGTIKTDHVCSEIYMPTSILVKILYESIVSGTQLSDNVIQLLTYANKGLETFL